MRVTIEQDSLKTQSELRYPSYRVRIDGENVGSIEWRFFRMEYGFWSDCAQWIDAPALYELHRLALELTAKHCNPD